MVNTGNQRVCNPYRTAYPFDKTVDSFVKIVNIHFFDISSIYRPKIIAKTSLTNDFPSKSFLILYKKVCFDAK